MQLLMDHIVIYASDITESDRFYTALMTMLGFTRSRAYVYQMRDVCFDVRHALREGDAHRRGDPGVDHFGFRAPNRDKVDQIMMDMLAEGFDNAQITEFENGDYSLFISDPDGVRFEITNYSIK
jgi:catechol 2,3-dioxygenase-like lactoylglutathione lyase family enzyme